jgi:excisionase family DNA binding protein
MRDNRRMYESWLTTEQAAQALACSGKTIQRMAARGEIQSGQRHESGRKDATVYHPEDVARIAQEKAPRAHLMPAANSQPGAMIPAPNAIAPAAAAFGNWMEAFRIPPPASPPPASTRFLNIAAAAEYSGLSQRWIRRAIKAEDGRLPALPSIRDGRTAKIRREDLDKL